MLTEEQKKKLNEPLPSSAIAERKQAGRALSYVQGWWIIDRLNEILGPGGWSYEVTTTEAVRDLVDDGEKGKRWHVSYRGSCLLTIAGCLIRDVGHGHGIDKDCGAAIESAEKEAATDALKRCAKSLGRSMGLALYDKAQEHVADDRSSAKADALVAALTNATSGAAIDAALKAFTDERRNLTSEDAGRVIAAGKSARARIEATQKTA